MSKKNQVTTCEALPWNEFLFLIDRLKRDADYRMLLLIASGTYLGLRISDLRLLRWSEVFGKSQLTIIEKKTRKSRVITLNQSYQDVLNHVFTQIQPTENSFLICNRKNQPYTIQHLNVCLHRTFEKYKIIAKNGSSHTMRKTFGRRIWEMNNKSEASLIMLGQIFNHSNISITKLYLSITMEEIGNIYKSL